MTFAEIIQEISDHWLEIVAIVALIAVSGFFSGSETALTAASRARMHTLETGGDSRAGIVTRLIERRDRLIGALLIGNNLVNILSSALATSLLLSIFGDSGVVIATIVMTMLLVIFAEVLPKSWAISMPDRFAMIVAPLVNLVVLVVGPLSSLVNWLVRAILRVFGIRLDPDTSLVPAHEEIRGAVDLLHREGSVIKDDRDRLAGRYLARVEDRARARGHRAAEHGGPVERHILVDRHAGMFVDQHLLGKGRQVEHLRHGFAAIACDARRSGLRAAGIAAETQGHPAGHAELTMPTEGGQAGDHVVARLDRLHFAADGAHHARRLVARDGRQRVRIGAVDEVQVRVAQAAGLGVDQHLVRGGIGQLDLTDGEAADLFEDCRLRHQRVAPMSPELRLSLPALGALPSRSALALGPSSGRCLANSIRAIERAWTSSGPSASRSVRWWA